jgi:hypothetical protein
MDSVPRNARVMNEVLALTADRDAYTYAELADLIYGAPATMSQRRAVGRACRRLEELGHIDVKRESLPAKRDRRNVKHVEEVPVAQAVVRVKR